jgi:hypothetical protein
MSEDDCTPGFKALVKNRRLTGVMFIHSWVTLFFKGEEKSEDGITIYSRLTVDKLKHQYATGEAGFRDKLCELIGESIAEVSSNKTHFTFVFKNKTKLLFELSMPDDPCPEVAFGHFGGQRIAFMNEHGED